MKEFSERKTIIILALNISKLDEIYQDQFKLPRNSKICKKKRKKNELLANNLASIITDFALFTRVAL